MLPIFALIRKDIILFLNDKRALFLTLVMPVVLAAFFGYLTGGSANKETAKIVVAVVNQDQHEITTNIVEGLKRDETLLIKVMSLSEAQDLVRKGKLAATIQFPEGFGAAAGSALFGAGARPDLNLYYDPSQTTTLAMVKGILTQQVMQHVSAAMFNGNAGNQMVEKSLHELENADLKVAHRQDLKEFLTSLQHYQQRTQNNKEVATGQSLESTGASISSNQNQGLSVPFSTKAEALTAKSSIETQYNGYAHSFAGMIVQFILFMAIDVGIGVLLVRKLGIWNRMLTAPVSVNAILTARALSCALISFILICLIFAIAMIMFKVQILGSVLGFIGIAMSFSLMTAAFGLLIAAFGKTPEAARGIAVFATLVMVMLGGAWLPSFLFPAWLQQLTVVIPTRWAVDGFDAMTWRGLGIDAALPAIAALLGFTLLFFVLAQWRFRQAQEIK